MDKLGDVKVGPERSRRRSSREKRKAMLFTSTWLEQNFYPCDGVCIPRCILYSQYLQFCRSQNLDAACSATFGKIIRQKFPSITTRRLGTRGHSKYHYYGISIRETSTYYQPAGSVTGLTRFSRAPPHQDRYESRYALMSGISARLRQFPTSQSARLPAGVCPDQFDTLFTSYRAHCQNVLEVIIASRIQEVEGCVTGYWRRLSHHLLTTLANPLVTQFICYCDCLFYESLTEVLLPGDSSNLTDGSFRDVQYICCNWSVWMYKSMHGMPSTLIEARQDAANRFIESLCHQSSFVHLREMVNPMLYDCNHLTGLINELARVRLAGQDDLPSTFTRPGKISEQELLCKFRDVLVKDARVESFTEWMDAIIDQHVVILRSKTEGNHRQTRRRLKDFSHIWSRFGSRVMEVLKDSDCAALLRLLLMLLDTYATVVMDSHIQSQYKQCLKRILDGSEPTAGAAHHSDRQDESYLCDWESAKKLEPRVSASPHPCARASLEPCTRALAEPHTRALLEPSVQANYPAFPQEYQSCHLTCDLTVVQAQLMNSSCRYARQQEDVVGIATTYGCDYMLAPDQGNQVWTSRPMDESHVDEETRSSTLTTSGYWPYASVCPMTGSQKYPACSRLPAISQLFG